MQNIKQIDTPTNGKNIEEHAWHALTTEDVLRHLEVQEEGLSN